MVNPIRNLFSSFTKVEKSKSPSKSPPNINDEKLSPSEYEELQSVINTVIEPLIKDIIEADEEEDYNSLPILEADLKEMSDWINVTESFQVIVDKMKKINENSIRLLYTQEELNTIEKAISILDEIPKILDYIVHLKEKINILLLKLVNDKKIQEADTLYNNNKNIFTNKLLKDVLIKLIGHERFINCVKWILSKGISPDIDELFKAIQNKNIELILLLLDYDVNPYEKNKDGINAFEYAKRIDRNKEYTIMENALKTNKQLLIKHSLIPNDDNELSFSSSKEDQSINEVSKDDSQLILSKEFTKLSKDQSLSVNSYFTKSATNSYEFKDPLRKDIVVLYETIKKGDIGSIKELEKKSKSGIKGLIEKSLLQDIIGLYGGNTIYMYAVKYANDDTTILDYLYKKCFTKGDKIWEYTLANINSFNQNIFDLADSDHILLWLLVKIAKPFNFNNNLLSLINYYRLKLWLYYGKDTELIKTGKIINPDTGKAIKIDSKLYNELELSFKELKGKFPNIKAFKPRIMTITEYKPPSKRKVGLLSEDICYNPEDDLMMEKWRGELKMIHFPLKDVSAIPTRWDPKGFCLNKKYIKQLLNTNRRSYFENRPANIFANWVLKKTESELDPAGFGGVPGKEVYIRIPLSSTNSTYTLKSIKRLYNEPNKEWYVVPLLSRKTHEIAKIRIGNLYGFFGISETHGQINEMPMYKLLTKEEVRIRSNWYPSRDEFEIKRYYPDAETDSSKYVDNIIYTIVSPKAK